jgi:putative ATP-binding cassette transporter
MVVTPFHEAQRSRGVAVRVAMLALILGGAAACGDKETPPPAIISTPLNATIDSLVAESRRDGKVPGMAITIVRGDSVIHSRGYGFANLEQQRPMTDSTPVVIGSTSKTFTSFAIMQLADGGKVALDSTIPHYVALLGAPTAAGRHVARGTPADSRFTTITVRHLLTNVSGIPAGFAGDPFDALDTATTALEDLARHDMLPRPLDFAPGKGYKYSNRGFSLASLVVQDASGEPYEDYIATHICPAGDDAQHRAPGGTVAGWQGIANRSRASLPAPLRSGAPTPGRG